MSLGEYFERFGPETWASHLNLDKFLFHPPITIANPSESAHAWMRRLIAINCGKVNLNTSIDELINHGKYGIALEAVQFLDNKPDMSPHIERISKALRDRYNDCQSLLKTLSRSMRDLTDEAIQDRTRHELNALQCKLVTGNLNLH